MTAPNPVNAQNAFLPIEFDVSVVKGKEDLQQLIAQRERLTSSCVNLREIASYEKAEIMTGQQWFSTVGVTQPRQSRYAFRVTYDLVALNGGPIVSGGPTPLSISSSTQPSFITGFNNLIPVHGFGAATTTTTFYFINDPLVFVRTNNMTTSTQTITITNNSGSNLTQAYWVFEYLKA